MLIYATEEAKLLKAAYYLIVQCFQTLTSEEENKIEIFLLQLINELLKDKLPFPMLMRPQIRGSQTLEDYECKLKKILIFRIEMNKFRSIKSDIIFRND
jgi:hypothetical protein